MIPMQIHVSTHPLAQHLLTTLRDKSTDPHRFRHAAKTLSTILAIESTTNLQLNEKEIETPIEKTMGKTLAQGLACVPVLRAGLSMLEPVLEIFPDVAVGYVGLQRDHDTAIAAKYYENLPNMRGKVALCLDPMLATGGSATDAIHLIKEQNPDRVIMVCVVAAPEGVQRLNQAHPDVEIYTASLDRQLNDLKYIMPGLGDYGDRLYGTL